MKNSFDDLPEQVSILLQEVRSIKELVLKTKETDDSPKVLNFDRTLVHIRGHGLFCSKSKLYKLCSDKTSGFPVHRAGRQLIFRSNEIDLWVESQIHSSEKSELNSIVKTSQRRSKIFKNKHYER